MLVLQYNFESEIQTQRANPMQPLSIVDLFFIDFSSVQIQCSPYILETLQPNVAE